AVEEMHSAGATFACKLDPRDLIAQFQRQVEPRRRALTVCRNSERGLGEALSARREGERSAVTCSALCANDEGFKTAVAIETCCDAERLVPGTITDHLQAAAARELLQGAR